MIWEAPQRISATFGDGLEIERAYVGVPRPGRREVQYVRFDIYHGALEDIDRLMERLHALQHRPGPGIKTCAACAFLREDLNTGGRSEDARRCLTKESKRIRPWTR